MKNQQEVIGKKNPWLCHLVKHQRKYLILVFLILISIPLLGNIVNNDPVIKGTESYYHLSQTNEITLKNFQYYPLKIINNYLPGQTLIIVPIMMGIISILLFIAITKKTNFTDRSTFFYLLLTIISPAFIWTFTTVSGYGIQLFLTLIGFYLLSRENKYIQIFSIIPFITATLVDFFSSIVLVSLLFVYYLNCKEQKKITKVMLLIVIFLVTINSIVLSLPFFLGPFYQTNLLQDLISDLGGISGISLFTLLIALIGVTITWKKKGFYFAYILLPIAITIYVLSPNTVIYMSLLVSFFATVGLKKLFERKWQLVSLKKFTFFLLVLGLLFSTLTYVDRVQNYLPNEEIVETLAWIDDNLPIREKVYSSPDMGYYIHQFAKKEALFYPNELTQEEKQKFENISQTYYVTELFPILEKNDVSIIYITKDMKRQFSSDIGLLFLLKNERFKLVHSHEDTEVWVFVQNKESD